MRTSIALLVLALPWACGDDPSVESRALSIAFEARASGTPVTCGADLLGMGAGGGAIRVRDLRMFVSNVRLVDADGVEAPLELDINEWQTDGIALLDFEDGSSTCSETGNAPTHSVITGRAAVGAISGLRFDVGLPFASNHIDPDAPTTPSPLNLTSMHWVWRGGYKFIRIDLEGDVPANNRFNVHLGSTGCESATPVDPPSEPCGRPNRPEIALEGFDPDVDTVVIDLAGLLDGVDTRTNTADTPVGCMSAPTEPDDCTPVFENLGLSFATGACVDGCAGQKLFARE